MSLINKMLQDLEQRQASTGLNEPLAGDVRSAQAVVPAPRTGLIVTVVLLTGAVVIAAVWMFLQMRSEPPVLVVAAPPVTAPVAVQSPAPAPVAPVAAVVVPPATTVAVPAPVAAAPQPAPAPVAPKAAAAPPVKAPEVQVAKAPEVPPAKPTEVAPKPPEKVAPAKAPPPVVTAVAPTPPAKAQPAPAVLAAAAPTPPVKAQPAPAPAVVAAVAPEPPAKVQPASTVVAAVAPPPQPATDAAKPLAKAPTAAEGLPQKSVSPQQLSENLYKQAVVSVQQGKQGEARDTLRLSLEAGPRNVAARQMLAGLLVENNNLDGAIALLRDGLKLLPEQSSFSMSLARLQLENADAAGAMATLEQGLPAVRDEPQYHAFYAALLQRAGRHDDAVKHYLAALRSDPSMANWLVGIGISLQAVGKETDAAEAFQRAKDTGQLPAQLLSFVDQRLGQLRR